MLYSPKQWDKPYAAMLLIHKQTKRTWLIACCYNAEYKGDTLYYGAELQEKWGLIPESIESVARSGSKFSVREMEHMFETALNIPLPAKNEPAA